MTREKRAAISKAKKAKWGAPLIQRKRPAAPFLRNERGFRFEKGVKRARGTGHV